LPMSQVARRVGISDAYYFSRQFRRHAGMSPTQWRRRWAGP
jgi:AraC-like DNA-binding protein